ncbi:hypothetical protein ACFWFU_06885 [Streptomyces sp. NPDC060235]|uniref:phage tail protein n=1 Tax=Streptomyces sp. NPDC060235 TaxID=3347080 RepID=UPI003664308F
MAEDINLPNLLSHLAVNLDGVSGAVADASQQGSSMGAALGRGVNRELDALLRNLPQVTVDGNSDPLDRDLARIHRELSQLDAQRIGVDIAVPDALRNIQRLQTQLQRLGDEHPDVNVQASTRQAARQLDELLAAAHHVDDTDVDIDVDVDVDRPNRLTGILGRLTGSVRGLAGVGTAVGGIAAKLGAAVPAAASVVTTLANIAPAAGVAVTGLAAVQLASGAVKLAMVGVGDAIGAALDPSKAEDYAEALKKLSPEARAFAEEIHDAQPALHALQQDVQDRVFKGLADQLERTGKSVLPVLRTNLLSSASALNNMATGGLMAAKYLADNGTLGRALGSASKGLTNLSGIPAIVVNSLGQIAAAAGPSFESLTDGAARAATKIGDKLSGAFESGAMQKAIEHAIDLIGQLATVGGNVVEIIGNVFNAIPAGGGGLVGVLEDVSSALASITSTPAVQSGLSAIFQTMSVLGASVAPLLAQALSAIAPIFTELGPPVQLLIQALQVGLTPVIDALGPVLGSAASAVGALVEAFVPLLPVIGQLIADLLPALVPLFDACREIFEAFAPSIEVIADILGQTLSPILGSLPGLLQPLLDAFVQMAQEEGPLLADLLTQLAPSFGQLGEAFGEVLTQLGPLLPQFLLLGASLFEQIAPYLPGLIESFAQLASTLTGVLVWALENIVIPGLQLLNDLLEGDTPHATAVAGKAIAGLETAMSTAWTVMVQFINRKIAEALVAIAGLPGKAKGALAGLAGSLAVTVTYAGAAMVTAISRKVSEAVTQVRSLPSKASSVLGGLGGILAGAGRSLIQGFINGIVSKFASVQSTLNGLTSKLPDWKGPKQKDAKILTPAGKLLIEGFIKGIDGTTAKLRSRLESITKALPANTKSGYGKTLAKATKELEKEVTKRDGVLKKLAAAQKKLDDLTKARSKAASDITKGILEDANITSGHSDVNSVSAITVGLQQALKSAKEFQANIAKLKKAGVRSDLLQEIADAGVEGGGATAAALAKATPAELKKINDLQAQLAKSATATGNTVGDALYNAGINAAKGLVAGLKSQEKAIEKSMEKIAKGMLTTTKKVHRTKSPSRAFFDIGAFGGMGLEGGFLSMRKRVQAAAQTVARSALDVASSTGNALLGTPSAAQLATVYAGSGGRGDTTNNFHLYGSDASPDGILHALSWRGLVGG